MSTEPGGPDFKYREAPPEELNNPYAKSKGSQNTMKWCAWEVLRDFPRGLTVKAIVDEIERCGLRSFEGKANPTGQVSGDMSRDNQHFFHFRNSNIWSITPYVPPDILAEGSHHERRRKPTGPKVPKVNANATPLAAVAAAAAAGHPIAMGQQQHGMMGMGSNPLQQLVGLPCTLHDSSSPVPLTGRILGFNPGDGTNDVLLDNGMRLPHLQIISHFIDRCNPTQPRVVISGFRTLNVGPAGGVYEAVGQKRQLEADLTLWGPSPKIPATDPAMFQQALNSLAWPPNETNSGTFDPNLFFRLQQQMGEVPSVHAPLQQGGAFSDELAALLSQFEQPATTGSNALEQQKQRLAQVLGLTKPLDENGAERASSGSADLRAMLSAGQNSSELLWKLANGWQPHLGESGSGGQQQLLSSPMVPPSSVAGTSTAVPAAAPANPTQEAALRLLHTFSFPNTSSDPHLQDETTMPSWPMPKEGPRDAPPPGDRPTEDCDAPANPFLASNKPALALDALLASNGSGQARGSGSGDGGTSSQLEALISGRPSPFVDEHKLVSRAELEQLLLKEINSSRFDSSAKLTNSEILRMGGSEMMEAGAAIPSISISKLLKTSDLMPVPAQAALPSDAAPVGSTRASLGSEPLNATAELPKELPIKAENTGEGANITQESGSAEKLLIEPVSSNAEQAV